MWNFSTGDPNLAALKAEQAAAAANTSANSSTDGGSSGGPPEETTPRGLNNWREATARAHTSAQLAMALYMLEASIAWDKSIMKAVSLKNPARKSVCVKLRNRSVSLKSATQNKQLMSSTQASVGICTNLLTNFLRFLSFTILTSTDLSTDNISTNYFTFKRTVLCTSNDTSKFCFLLLSGNI